MTVYLANVAMLFVWASLLLWHEPSRVKRATFCIIASIQWIAISGLRHPSVGADTYAYRANFSRVMGVPWGRLTGDLWATYFGVASVKDPGYSVLVKATQLFMHDYQVFLVFVAAVFTIPLGWFIYRRSVDPFISFLIYSCLFASFFAITGVRQTIATALVVLVGYEFIEKRRLAPFLILTVVAFTIHKSAIVFFPAYFLLGLRFTHARAAGLLVALAVVAAFRHPIVALVGSLLGYGQFTSQFVGAGAWVFAGMLLLVYVVALLRASTVLTENPMAVRWYNALFVALALTPATFVDPNTMRVVQYYSLFLVLLLPSVLRSFKDPHERALAYTVAVPLLVALFARGNPQYLFFWQA